LAAPAQPGGQRLQFGRPGARRDRAGGAQPVGDGVPEPVGVLPRGRLREPGGGPLVVLPGRPRPAQVAVGLGDVEVQRGVEPGGPLAAARVRAAQALPVPVQRLLRRRLLPGQVVRGDARPVVVGGGLPGAVEQVARVVRAAFGLGPHALGAQPHDGVVGVVGVHWTLFLCSSSRVPPARGPGGHPCRTGMTRVVKLPWSAERTSTGASGPETSSSTSGPTAESTAGSSVRTSKAMTSGGPVQTAGSSAASRPGAARVSRSPSVRRTTRRTTGS